MKNKSKKRVQARLYLGSIMLLFISTTIFTSCKKERTTPDVETASVSYASTNLEAIFYQSGNSATPSLDWNGNQGSFSITSPVDGLSINTTTGALSWTKLLALGTYAIEVVATNSAGNTLVNITLTNILQGVFTGTYSGNIYQQFDYKTDGTVSIKATDETTPDLASGTWEIDGDEVTSDYTYDFGGAYSIKGTLVQTNANATISGQWYYGHGAIDGEEGGPFEHTLD